MICSANEWTGFCIIGTFFMKDSRCCSSTYTKSLFLHVVKDVLLFLLFFFVSGFSFTSIHYSQNSRLRGGLFPFYRFYLLHRHQDISWVIAVESSPLRITGSWNRTWNLWHTLFKIHSFYTCTGTCCC